MTDTADDLLECMQDSQLRAVLPHQLPEAFFGEVGLDLGVTPVVPKCSQRGLRQIE